MPGFYDVTSKCITQLVLNFGTLANILILYIYRYGLLACLTPLLMRVITSTHQVMTANLDELTFLYCAT